MSRVSDPFLRVHAFVLRVLLPSLSFSPGFNRRYAFYMQHSPPEKSMLTYLEENGCIVRRVESEDGKLEACVEALKQKVGEPRNYGLTPDEMLDVEAKDRLRKVRYL